MKLALRRLAHVFTLSLAGCTSSAPATGGDAGTHNETRSDASSSSKADAAADASRPTGIECFPFGRYCLDGNVAVSGYGDADNPCVPHVVAVCKYGCKGPMPYAKSAEELCNPPPADDNADAGIEIDAG